MHEPRTPARLLAEAKSIYEMLNSNLAESALYGPSAIEARIERLERWARTLLRARAQDLREEAARTDETAN